ncbi:MAG: DUF2313 domain-containing protein [Clostridia bacterium]|nr:DUF2313 domain-containing protein [Clostridia bacterium]
MERSISDYLPHFIRHTDDFEAICEGEQPEFEALWDEAERALSNQFIDTADGYGIGRFESLLRIVPKGTDSLEYRRQRVKAGWFAGLPFTLRWLKMWLECRSGGGGSVSVGDYMLHVTLDRERTEDCEKLKRELVPALSAICPANMGAELETKAAARAALRAGAYTECCVRAEVWPAGMGE